MPQVRLEVRLDYVCERTTTGHPRTTTGGHNDQASDSAIGDGSRVRSAAFGISGSRPTRRSHRGHGGRRGGRCAAGRGGDGNGCGRAAGERDRRDRGVRLPRAPCGRLRRRSRAARLRHNRGRGRGAGRRHRDGPTRSGDRTIARDRQRRRRGAAHLRAQRRRRADDDAAVEHHRRDVGGGQPARGVRPGGRCVRLRRLVEQRRHARLPGDHQRGADRHHHRRFPERHVRLLERLEGEPVHRPDEPRRRRGLAGDRRHRLAVGRGAGRHVRLPDGRSGGGTDLQRVVHARRERGPAVLHAGRHGAAVRRRRNARLDRRRPAGGDRLGGGLRTQRAGARRRQARLVARASGSDELPLVRQHPRGCVPAALRRGRLPGQPAVGPPDRRVARRPVPEPVLPARLADPAEQHVRVPQGGLVVQRRHVVEPGRLFPSQPGPRRLAASLHRRRRPTMAAERSRS